MNDLFDRGVAEIINEKSLKDKLEGGKKLRIKYGVDPTKPDIHLGHAVALWKLKALQDEGHTIIFLIGDFTTKIGDPSGRNNARPVLTDEEIKVNAKSYFDQVGKILDLKKTEVRYNSEWFEKMDLGETLKLAGKFTVAQIIERDDFEKRLKGGCDIGVHEIFYPLMQAHDSVVLKADVEFGGVDQKFNMLAGRDLQRKMGQTPQEVVMMKLLVGLDGKVKMSKSANNYISITESANEMFGKVMSIPDSVIDEYFLLCTKLPESEIASFSEEIKAGKNPRDIKLILAEEIVKLYHTAEVARKAKEEFINVFSKKELPSDIPEIEVSIDQLLPQLIFNLGLAHSNSEARRLVLQNAVTIDGEKSADPKSIIKTKSGMLIQVGRKFVRIK